MLEKSNVKNILLILVGLLVGSIVTFATVKYSGDTDKGAKREASSTAGKKEKKVLYWKAPMNPNYISDKPGKSPMGMDLIPVYEGEDDTLEPGTVKIDPVTQQNIGVKIKIAKKMVLKKTIRTIGRVDYNEKKVYRVHTKVEGWVEKLYVDFTGQEVNKDDILLGIYSPELVATQEEYLLAKKFSKTLQKGRSGSESTLELSRRRLEFWDVPDHQIKELDEKGVIIKTLHIHSPARGIVTKKYVQEGMFVKPEMSLYTIADISDVWVYVDIYEYEMPWIKVGQEAEMTLNSYPGRVFKGKVSFIYPFIEAKTRTIKVRLEFDNPKWELKPDMYANITLKSIISRETVAVPKEAVILSGERSIVILDRGEGKFTPKDVRLGAEAEGYYQVLEGIEEGDRIVTSAHFLIDSESRLKEAISKMLEPKRADEMEGAVVREQGTEDIGWEAEGRGQKAEDKQPKANEMDHSKMKMDDEAMKHEEMDHSKMKH